MATTGGWIGSLVTVCHIESQQHASRKKFDSFFVSENVGAMTPLNADFAFLLYDYRVSECFSRCHHTVLFMLAC